MEDPTGKGDLLTESEVKYRWERLMNYHHMSKADLARKLGISYNATLNIFKRESWKKETLIAMAKVFGVNVAYFIWRPATMKGGYRGKGRSHSPTKD